MVSHDIILRGVDLQGKTQAAPVLLQMNQEDFPQRFLSDLAQAPAVASQLSSTKALHGSAQQPVQLFQPVQRILHVAALQLACDALTQPPLDPLRVVSAGFVIRRLRRQGNGYDPNPPYQSWMKSADGRFQWQVPGDSDADPDPQLRPALQSGQAYLDAQLAVASLTKAKSEVFTSAFLAPPATNATLGRTILYGVIPTASNEVSDATQAAPVYDSNTLAASLPTLLKSNSSAPSAPAAGVAVDYRWLSDEYATASPRSSTTFPVFSAALLMLYRQFGAFDNSTEAQQILAVLGRRNVTITVADAQGATIQLKQSMADFYQQAKSTLIDFDPQSGQQIPTITMPTAWDALTMQDQQALVAAMAAALKSRTAALQPPEGRYQDPARLYVLRAFVRVKGHTPNCPTELYWSNYSDIFRIAAWYDSTQRPSAPIPLPDPTLRNFLAGAKANVSFSVPKGLMNAMQGTSLKNLSDGSASGSNLNLNWICGFNIPLITICAFFVLNIFLSLLNIVFFWLPFIKICIPIPVTMPPSGDD